MLVRRGRGAGCSPRVAHQRAEGSAHQGASASTDGCVSGRTHDESSVDTGALGGNMAVVGVNDELTAGAADTAGVDLGLAVSAPEDALGRAGDGASVGAPPPSIPTPKYVLGLGWVASSTPVPSPAELHSQSATLEEYPL